MPAPTLPLSFKEASVPKIKISEGKETRSRKFTVDAADIETLIEALFPIAFTAGTEIVRRSPTEYPDKEYLLLTGISIEPLDEECIKSLGADGVAVGTKHMVMLDYSTKPKNEYTIDVDNSAEFLRVPASGQMRWSAPLAAGGDRMTADAVAHRILPTRTLTVVWKNVPAPNWDAFSDQEGTLNNATFCLCAEETVLFVGVQARERVNSQGDIVYDLTFKFVQKKVRFTGAGTSGIKYAGWNHLYRPDVVDPTVDDQWQTTEPRLYETSDFNQLFKQGTSSLREAFKNDAGMEG